MAYPVYEDTGTPGITVSATVYPSYPTTVNVNDILFYISLKDTSTSGAVTSPPSGFIYINHAFIGASSNSNIAYAIYYKRAEGDESGTESMQWSTSPTSIAVAYIVRISGCIITGTPYEASAIDANPTTRTSSGTLKGLTTLGSQRLLVNFMGALGQYTDSTTDISTASGWNFFDSFFSGTGRDYDTQNQYRQVPTATAVSDQSSAFTQTGTPVDRWWWSYSFAMIPKPGWSHNFLGIVNANISKINTVAKGDIETVNEVS